VARQLDVKPADNMYPAVPHSEQKRAARTKLAEKPERYGGMGPGILQPNGLLKVVDRSLAAGRLSTECLEVVVEHVR